MTHYSLHALKCALFDLIAHTYNLDPTTINSCGITLHLIEGTQAAQGDLATNAALVLARKVGQPPRVIAQTLCQRLQSARADSASPLHAVAQADSAGPGFINMTFDQCRMGTLWSTTCT